MDQSSPTSDFNQIFHDLNDPVEYVDEYTPGGYHPVRLGDRLRDDRYLVLRKLGYGSYSTVWLARDQDLSEFVALKIIKARCSNQHELEIYDRLTASDHHPGSSNVLLLKDHFTINGPNGIHSCLVYEARGPNVPTMIIDSVQGEPYKPGQSKRFTLSAARKILHQVLLGLDFMHSNGLVHGDFHSGNWLLSLRDISGTSVEDLRQSEAKVSAPLRRLDGYDVEPGAPRFLNLDQPLREWVAIGKDLRVKISDLGNAFSIESPPPNLQTPINLRSPELLLLNYASPAQDIWAFGCLVYSLLTNQSLFDLFDMGSREYLDDDHIIQLIAALGPLPASLKRAWSRYGKYFDENDVQTVFELDWAPSLGSGADEVNHHVEEDGAAVPNDEQEEKDKERPQLELLSKRDTPIQDLYPTLIEVYTSKNSEFGPPGDADALDMAPPTQPTQPPLRERWLRDHRRLDMSVEEADAIASLLEQILRYEPSERPSTAEILRHPWIEGFCAGAR